MELVGRVNKKAEYTLDLLKERFEALGIPKVEAYLKTTPKLHIQVVHNKRNHTILVVDENPAQIFDRVNMITSIIMGGL
jgi:hypothetical protein